VVGLDFAQEMLDDAARRDDELPAYWDRAPIEWVQGDALQLPFDDSSFDAATMGFGLRCVYIMAANVLCYHGSWLHPLQPVDCDDSC
jgi:ubiquinone/menaquinone biosynthesis C-methylase UbiE